MAQRPGTVRSRARLLKSYGLIKFDLREKLTPARKAAITKQWAKTEPIRNLDVKAIRVKKSTKTGARMRVGNTVFVAREGADRITWNQKTGTITKSIKQAGGRKRVKAPMNPKPQDLEKEFAKLKRGQHLMIRSAAGKGITAPGHAYDAGTLLHYKKMRVEQIAQQARRTQGKTKKEARAYAREIMDQWYTVEVESE